jgi:hypothetical protein
MIWHMQTLNIIAKEARTYIELLKTSLCEEAIKETEIQEEENKKQKTNKTY